MWLLAVRVIAVVCTGLYAGIIFGDRLGASYARPELSAGGFVTFQQIQHLHFKPVLMPLTLLAAAASLIWVGLAWHRGRDSEFWLAAAGAAAMLVAFIVTRLINFPINDALMTWSAASPPADVRTQWAPWEQAHTIRATASVIAFTLQVLALSATRRT